MKEILKYIKGLFKQKEEPFDGEIIRLSKKEVDDIEKVERSHRNCKGKKKTSLQYSIVITPTGIGDCVAVRCNRCGKEFDVTDVDCW